LSTGLESGTVEATVLMAEAVVWLLSSVLDGEGGGAKEAGAVVDMCTCAVEESM